MLEPPIDAIQVWLGLSLASVAVLGVVTALPTAPPPDATAAAGTVDAVASSRYAAATDHPLDGATVRLSPRRLRLDRGAATATATFAYGPVTPVEPGSPLARVLTGTSPDRVFDSPTAFRSAAERSRERAPIVASDANRLVVRRVTWRGTDVTLVGA